MVLLHGVLACPHDKFQLNVQKESLTLEDLRNRLAQVYSVSDAASTSLDAWRVTPS